MCLYKFIERCKGKENKLKYKNKRLNTCICFVLLFGLTSLSFASVASPASGFALAMTLLVICCYFIHYLISFFRHCEGVSPKQSTQSKVES
jgi:hypothetical protein